MPPPAWHCVHRSVSEERRDGFEWDEDKRRRNLEEHGVDFRLAARIFRNTVIEAEDEQGGSDEPRYRALGHVGDEYFVVAYT
jgi:uncharacterized DUF497 family protein